MNSADQETIDALGPHDRAAQVLARFLTEVDAGQDAGGDAGRTRVLAEHPECAAALKAYFQLADRLSQSIVDAKQSIDQIEPATLDLRTMRLGDQQTQVLDGDLLDGDLLDGATPLSASAPSRPAPPLSKGATPFGDYELLEPIARGGMGIVYKARQRRLNRIVAVKMILGGQFADQGDVDRFYAEAEAAANLRHPHIVGIHEVGQFQGQHFFSMDFIEGESLADKVREKPLPPDDAARYTKTIAEAMQYAHDRGILHRDLKPANVLVDGDDQPLVTDFGLSKRVDGASQLTMTGGIIGTPSYMPPEQAGGRGDQIGVCSDVYSLGAVLYQLLTGSPPFRSANVAQTIQQVLHDEPISPRTLNPNLPRDLETICLKCLQKEPARRYATAQQLADELRRYLDGEPILARPIGRAARAVRWCRRNPTVASLSAAAVGLLVALLVVSAIFNVELAANNAQLEIAKQESERFLRQAEQAVDELFVEVSENTLLNQPGMQPVREKLLRRALDYYQRFLAQRSGDASIQDQLAQTHFRIGVITEVIESRETAIVSYQQARSMQARLVELHPDAGRLEALGKTLNALGNAQQRLRRFEASRLAYDEAISIRQRLTILAPNSAEFHRTLANSHMNVGLLEQQLGRVEQAREQFDVAQGIRREFLDAGHEDLAMHVDLGKGWYNLALLAHMQQDYATARQQFDQAIEAFQHASEHDADDMENQHRLATCYQMRADVAETPQQALELFTAAQSRLESLARRNPTVLDYQFESAGLQLTLGEVYRSLQQWDDARAAFQQACDVLRPLVAKDGDSVRYRRELAVALRALAVEQAAAGDAGKAKQNLLTAKEYLEQLVAEFGDADDFRLQLEETTAVFEELNQSGSPPSSDSEKPAQKAEPAS
ncbi:MAG: serine/threonine-protein kinase [Pirellulaceae bacterium]